MLNLLKSIRLSQLFSGLGVMVVGLSLLQASMDIRQTRQQLYSSADSSLQATIDVAISLVSHYQAMENDIGIENAQALAIEAVADLRYQGNEYFWINDTQLNLLMHPLRPENIGKNMRSSVDADGKAHWQAMLDVANKNGEGSVEYRFMHASLESPKSKMSYVKKVPGWDWIIGTGVYIDHIEAAVRQEIMTKLIFTLSMLTIGLLILIPITRLMKRQLSAASDSIQLFSQGNYDTQVKVEGNNDLSELGHNLEAMRKSMVELLQKLSQNQSQLTHVSASISTGAKQTDAAASQQFLDIDGIASAMTQMTSSIAEVAMNTDKVAQISAQTSNNANHINQSMQKNAKQSEQLSLQIGESQASVMQLSESSQQIGTIVDVINSISEQTNLLALNAAIEAARAGAHGRGFAVVADEVRNLAGRTKEATQEIMTMIHNLQQLAGKVDQQIETSVSGIQNQQKDTDASIIAIQEITSLMDDLEQRSHQNSVAAEQQNVVSNEINQSVVALRSGSEVSAQSANRNNELAEQLNRCAEQLELQTRKFQFN
ncbi:methyl-accepting chemotaxis protein [Alginatibacterium sediminis]|uniref:Methyl-accepting chemotaxis protein n=1 Tax=Alginatibacterium sediminis TaxID=2164068 RepID=A0A420E8D3_9ALTE|nr:methyl-accepting chemotaxis protein [Alginatibacterium sediminis]RKF15617.1 methyl-accepting chemotaxis protein [Alginatibacterium sediminis]